MSPVMRFQVRAIRFSSMAIIALGLESKSRWIDSRCSFAYRQRVQSFRNLSPDVLRTNRLPHSQRIVFITVAPTHVQESGYQFQGN